MYGQGVPAGPMANANGNGQGRGGRALEGDSPDGRDGKRSRKD